MYLAYCVVYRSRKNEWNDVSRRLSYCIMLDKAFSILLPVTAQTGLEYIHQKFRSQCIVGCKKPPPPAHLKELLEKGDSLKREVIMFTLRGLFPLLEKHY